mgnify:CR=1 FL=1
MRRWIYTSFLVFTFISLLYSSVRISEFHARRERNYILLEWATEFESNLLKFEIERSPDRIHWIKIGEVSAIGESNQVRFYTFKDQTLLKGNVASLSYRLNLVYKNGTSELYDVIVSVEGISGIRQTWGSIKAMFR